MMDEADPGRGDIAAIREVASERRTRSLALRDAALILTTTAAVDENWAGEAGAAFRGEANHRARQLAALERRYAKHARALDQYATTVESIRSRAVPLRATIDNGLAYVDRFVHNYANVKFDAPDFFQPLADLASSANKAYTEGMWWLVRKKFPLIDQQLAQVERARDLLAKLEEEREAADRACVQALRIQIYSGPVSGLHKGGAGGSQLFERLLENPHLLEALATREPADPAAIAALWATLTPSQRLALARTYPQLIGNLQGVPYSDRSIANRVQLNRDIAATQRQIQADPTDDDARSRLEGLNSIRAALGKNEGEGEPGGRYLISYSLADRPPQTDQPLAAVSYGNLDTADYATYLVPGMDTTAKGMGDLGAQAQAVRDSQRAMLGPDASVAVVGWLGYVTPNKISVFDNDHAEEGAKRLAAELDGYSAVQAAAGHETHLGVVAHSYGSTTAMLALQQNHGVDSLVVFGSAGQVPGTTVDLARDDFTIIKGDGEGGAKVDVIAEVGIVGSGRVDPADTGQGTVEGTEAAVYVNQNGSPIPISVQTGVRDHSDYLDRGTGTLEEIAARGLGIKEKK